MAKQEGSEGVHVSHKREWGWLWTKNLAWTRASLTGRGHATRDLCHNSEEKFRRRSGGTDVLEIFEVGKHLRSWAQSCITQTWESSKQLSCVYVHRWEARWSPVWSWDWTHRPRGDFFLYRYNGKEPVSACCEFLDLRENAMLHWWINVCCKCLKRSVCMLRLYISCLQASTLVVFY